MVIQKLFIEIQKIGVVAKNEIDFFKMKSSIADSFVYPSA